MSSLAYLLEANLSLLLFIGLYQLVLKRLTFFAWNRFYLLGGLLLSLLIPLVPLDSSGWGPSGSVTMTHWVTQVVTTSPYSPYTTFPSGGIVWGTLLKLGYWLAVSYRLSRLLLDIRSVLRLARQQPTDSIESLRIIWVPDTLPASSFFHYVFLPENGLQGEALAVTLRHEQAHAQQWHTLDWLLVRLVSALFWFNPLMRHWQRAIAANHEYLADAATVEAYDAGWYCHLLVSRAARPGLNTTLHYFSSSQLKSRIIMIHQLRSKALKRLRFLGVAPLLGVLLFLVSCEQMATQELVNPTLAKGAYLFNDLIGNWTNTDRTTINANDGQTPRDFPERGGDVRACLSSLVLGADGRFHMSDERTGQTIQGTWESDRVGVSVQLHYVDPSATTDASLAHDYVNRADGSLVKGPFPKTISLDVTSLKAGRLEAWQAYSSQDGLSGGTIYYQYQKKVNFLSLSTKE